MAENAIDRAIEFLRSREHNIPENPAHVGADGYMRISIDEMALTYPEVIRLAQAEKWVDVEQ